MSYTDLEIAISEYKELKKQSKKVPQKRDLSNKSQNIIIKNYGLWRCFLQEMGDYAENAIKYHDRGISNLQLVEEIRDLYKRLGYPPKAKQYFRSRTAVNRLGGSWKKVLETCHIPATFVRNSNISKQELVFKGKKEIEKYGKMPTWRQLEKDSFSVNQILIYWGNLTNFAKEFNLSTVREKKRNDIQTLILKLATELNEKHKPIKQVDIIALSNGRLDHNKINNFLKYEVRHNVISNLSLEEFLNRNGIQVSTKTIRIGGKTFNSWTDAMNETGISICTLRSRAAKYGKDNQIIFYHGRITKEVRKKYLSA